MSISNNLKSIQSSLASKITLVAVSKTKSKTDILEAYRLGQRIFGENKVQELIKKYKILPKDISWHMIGHLQRNKVKFIAPFISLIHTIDSLSLLKEVNKRAAENNRVIDCLLQVHIASENTKYGFEVNAVKNVLDQSEKFTNIKIIGLMGMATFTDDTQQILQEFKSLKTIFDSEKNEQINTLSMGMSGDYNLAINQGSTMVRIGNAIFGNRKK